MKNAFIGVFILGVLFLAACSTFVDVEGTKVTDEQIASFTKGKTTRAEVVAVLGGPQDMKLEGGKEILIYRYRKSGAYTSQEGWDTTFIFNNGVLEDVLKSEAAVSSDRRR